MGGFRGRMLRLALLSCTIVLVLAGSASADSLGPITFEAGYVVGDIDGQQGWSNAGHYYAAVAAVASFPKAAGYGFGTKALRISNAIVSGAFDQTYTPGLASA